MGLLETILTKPKPCVIQGSFAPLCRAHGFIHAILLKRISTFTPLAVCGYDCTSAKKADSTLSFWNGIIDHASTTFFNAKESGFPLFQFFSSKMCAQLETVFVQRFKYGETEYIFMAPILNGEQIGKAFSGNDIKQLIKAESLKKASITIQDIQDCNSLFCDCIEHLESEGITSDSPAFSALLSGIFEAYGFCAWATPRFTDTLLLSKIQILALERRKNVEKTLVDILSDTTEQSVSPSFTITNERSAQKAASIFFGEESND